MGGEPPNLGLVLTSGSICGYSVERDLERTSNDRGDFILHTAPFSLAPNDTITREQAAAMLYHYAKSIGADTSVGDNTNILSYDDYSDISKYAIAAICWTAGSGIMKGRTDSTVNPINTVTRAETAQIIYNYIQYYKAD